MKRLLTLFFSFALFFYTSAQQSKPIQFREEIFDFGSVKEDGGPVTHEFVFANASNRPVKILAVQASCGCTTPAWSKDPIEPGKNGFIQASYNPKGRPGYFNKTLTVTTDYEATPIVLQIKGSVSTEGVGSDAEFRTANGSWKLRQGSFNMGKVFLKDEYTVRDFPFLNAGTKPVTFDSSVAPEYIKVDVVPKTVAPGEKGHIKVSYNGKVKNQYGFHSDNVEIHTDDEANAVKSFTVYATLEDYFPELKPEELAKAPQLQLGFTSFDFGKVTQHRTVTREVAFTNTGKKELQLKALQGNCSCVTASAAKTSVKPGESSVIKISFNSQDRRSTQQKAVTIYSNDPLNPVQRITFSAYVEN